MAYPIKGTGLFNQIKPLITQQPDWKTSTDREIDFKRTYPRMYYDYAVRKIVNEVNYHKVKLQGKLFSKQALLFKVKSIISGYRMKLLQ